METVQGAAAPTNLFKEAQDDADAAENARKQDKKVAYLIGAKNLERLRAFGYQVIKVGDELEGLTTDRRSTED